MRFLLTTYLTKFWDFVDTRGVIRRIVLGATMWMTFWVSYWAGGFALRALELSAIKGGDVVMIIGAVTLPIVTLGGYVFKVYLDSRSA